MVTATNRRDFLRTSLAFVLMGATARDSFDGPLEQKIFIGRTMDFELIYNPANLATGHDPSRHHVYDGIARGYLVTRLERNGVNLVFMSLGVVAMFRNPANCKFDQCGMLDLLDSKHPEAKRAYSEIKAIIPKLIRRPNDIYILLKDNSSVVGACRPAREARNGTLSLLRPV